MVCLKTFLIKISQPGGQLVLVFVDNCFFCLRSAHPDSQTHIVFARQNCLGVNLFSRVKIT